ncbi:uncharacterized protein MELLADRAFT_69722 [Melampsora larici-populina 98AG31]|uniref:J domain-containing protein n=1 Tax=Melampsora larici-populina (strain 98AG31 / pathotype 3-4-7) TaxID=747676 RepID=F4SBX5_MELLP|nr:uncharacterized protein MELLADRAFT_69722 [Melampsora larici-populina 98AG31]EGF97854.1 hypothetical protein MELLADRAFT_69722 [Melampsora larici-populina 98AG31]
MNLSIILSCILGSLLCFSNNVYGWDTDDHEIFDLVSALEASEGKGTTFYTFLNITKSASLPEINKAARRRSLELHPDKNPNVKDIEARFARLGVITAILRDEEKRERYNFFHDNGVPKWKGTGYMYSRWQPGLGFAIMFVLSVATLMHYGIQHVHYRSELIRIRKFQIAAKQAAYGPKGLQAPEKPKPSSTTQVLEKEETESKVPRKKVKISIEKSLSLGEENLKAEESSSSSSDVPMVMSRQERRRQLQAGQKNSNLSKPTQAGWIDMVVEGDFVWIVAEDGTDESAATKPSLKNTFIPATAYRFVSSYLPMSQVPGRTEEVVESNEKLNQQENEGEGEGDRNSNGMVRKRKTGKSKK